jgi:hypothetical protein
VRNILIAAAQPCVRHPIMSEPLSEEQLVAANRGKWSQAGVPHKGWSCVDTEDLGEPELTCQMCESRTIRYVHYMEHPQYPDVLQVGCICAGNMEGSVGTARLRETSMQSRAGKRKRWLSRKWRVSVKGNPWIKADGYRVTVYFQTGGWGARPSPRKLGHLKVESAPSNLAGSATDFCQISAKLG